MPFPFVLPTTSSTSLTDYYTSPSHPSLLLTATTQRSVVRDALKKHKRLPPSSQPSHLSTVNEALNAYLPYLLLLHGALTSPHQSQVDVSELKALETQWRPTLTRSPVPGREPERAKVSGLQHEVAFVLQSLAYVQVLQARTALFALYASPPPSQDQRAAAIATAMKYLLEANSILGSSLSLSSASVNNTSTPPVDISPATLSALASLTLAEATLITVLKDDPYTTTIIEARSAESKEWMIRAPSIPKVRAHLFARLCLASADHAAKASALLAQSGARIDDALLKYADDLRRTARAKAARFLGVDAEAGAKTGEAIAWMRGARHTMGFLAGPGDDDSKRKGLKGLKQSWAEKREDRKVLKGDNDTWGLDAGKLEEARVVEWLEGKWTRENDAVGLHTVPPFEGLLALMPSGREYHTPKHYVPPTLDQHVLAQMRAPVDEGRHVYRGTEADSGDEQDVIGDNVVASVPGAFPGASRGDGVNTPAYF